MSEFHEPCFTLKLAGIPFRVSPMYPMIREISRDYLTEEAFREEIVTRQEDIEFERRMCARADRYLNIPDRVFGDDQLESFSILRKTAEKLPYYNTVYMHASALTIDGQGVLFAAKSRGGKSTHAGFWREMFGERVTMINDDKPILQLQEHGVRVYGSPWCGKHRIATASSAPVRAICFLTKAAESRITPLSPIEALPSMLHFTHRPYDRMAMEKTMEIVENMAGRIRFYDLQVEKNLHSAQVAYTEIMRDFR